MSLFDILGASQNGANSSQAYTGASNAVRGEAQDAISALNNGRDAALDYLNPTQQLGISAGQTLGNAYGLNGSAAGGSQAGLTRADPYNIGAPTVPTQATFNAPQFNFDPSTVNADSDPGLAYARQQALGAVGQNAYATGKGLSGAATIQLAGTAANLANQGYNAAYNRDLGLATQNYTQQYGASSDDYNRNTTYNNQNYTDQYGAATDAYARQNAQFQNYLSGVNTLNAAGNTAAAQAAGVQTGTSAQAASNDQATGNTLANLTLGKAAAGNAANTQLLSSIQNTGTDAVKAYLGLG